MFSPFYNSISATLSPGRRGVSKLQSSLGLHGLSSCLWVCLICACYTAHRLQWKPFPYYPHVMYYDHTLKFISALQKRWRAGANCKNCSRNSHSYTHTHLERGEKICIHIHWVCHFYSVNLVVMQKRGYYAQFSLYFRTWGLPTCFASVKALHIFESAYGACRTLVDD